MTLTDNHKGIRIYLGHQRFEATYVGPGHRAKQDRVLGFGEHTLTGPGGNSHPQAIEQRMRHLLW
jgi:hypothetical protein